MPIVDHGWLVLLPPVLAIVLALVLRQVVVALVAGVWLGGLLLQGFDPILASLRTVDTHVVGAVADADHASILIFTLLLGGMLGIVLRSGGGAGLANWMALRSSTPRRAQLATWLLGLVLFIDDYANALLVGPTMRPVTDRLRISREKLAFLVDATAAPVSSIALVSSWIGVEVGYIAEQLQQLGIERDAYVVFVETLPYRFYPILMLVFGLMVVLSGRDFGPMRRAEHRAATRGLVLREGAQPLAALDESVEPIDGQAAHALNAVLPLLVTVVVAVLGLYLDGRIKLEAKQASSLDLRAVLGAASSLRALLWASAAGSVAALLTSLATRVLTFGAAMDAWLRGVRSVVLACIILTLAWALAGVCHELGTAQYLTSLIGNDIPVGLLPALVFLVAAAVSFATGTSWGAMAILFPLVIPLIHNLAPGETPLLLSGIASILAGAVWGDHCSPISDTTVLSSLATACDHLDHVRTQIPYAVLVAVVGLLLGDVPVGLGLYPAWVGLLLGAAALWCALRWFGSVRPSSSPTGPPGS